MDEFETHFGVKKDVAKGYVQYDTIYVKPLNKVCYLLVMDIFICSTIISLHQNDLQSPASAMS